ncbi:hypothetical protein U1Q18_030948 [Sarracenia purpurea var. burkii]
MECCYSVEYCYGVILLLSYLEQTGCSLPVNTCCKCEVLFAFSFASKEHLFCLGLLSSKQTVISSSVTGLLFLLVWEEDAGKVWTLECTCRAHEGHETNQKENPGNGIDVAGRKAIGKQDEVHNHGGDNGGHEGGADEEGVSVLEGCGGLEFKDEVGADPMALPHQQIAPIHEHVQA